MWSCKIQDRLYSPVCAGPCSFLYCIAEAVLGTGNRRELSQHDSWISTYLKFNSQININNYKRFEVVNPTFRVNIVCTEDEGRTYHKCYISRQPEVEGGFRINLLYSFGTDEPHFHLITNLPNLYSLKNIRPTMSSHRIFVCPRCLHRSYSIECRLRHIEICKRQFNGEVKLIKDQIEFKNIQNTSRAPLLIFFDFEAKNIETNCCDKSNCQCRTKKLKEQRPICYSLYVINTVSRYIVYNKTYCGDDADSNLITTLLELRKLLEKILDTYIPLSMSDEDVREFESQDVCGACKKPMGGEAGVRDHSHYTGQFRGKCHNKCNLLRRRDRKVVCYAHNLTNYDGHFIMSALAQTDCEVELISNNSQKAREIRIDNFFILRDSLEFLSGGLDKLVSLVKEQNHDFPFVASHPLVNSENMDLVTRKGVFPYGLVKSLEQLEGLTSFPPLEDFYNDLEEKHIQRSDWEFGHRLYETFGFRNMKEYMTFYCEIDTLLLSEVVLLFVDLLFTKFTLDPSKYISLPSYTYDLMLKETGLSIDPIPDQNMYHFIKKGVRGGLSYINTRYAHRNGQKIDQEMDENVIKQSFMYIDAK